MASQQKNGYLVGSRGGNMYCHGMATLAMSEAYASHFHDPLPARSSVVVTRLKNPEMLIEIEAIAVVG